MSSSAGCHSRSRARTCAAAAWLHRAYMPKSIPAPCAAGESSLAQVSIGARRKALGRKRHRRARWACQPRASAGLCERERVRRHGRRPRSRAGPCDRGFASSSGSRTRSRSAPSETAAASERRQRAVKTEQKKAPASSLSVVVCADRLHRGRRSQQQRAHSHL